MSELVGAELGERRPEDRMTHRNGYRPREWQTRAGTVELQIPKLRRGSYFPSFLEPRRRSEQALLAVIQQAYVCGVSTRRVDQLVESLGLRVSKSEVSRICALLDEHVEAFRTRPLEGAYPYLFLDAKVEKVRDGGRVVNKALVIAHGVHETRAARDPLDRRRRGRDRGVLDRVPPRPGRARPGRRSARHLRRARRAEGRDREGPRLRLAALHGPLPARLPRPRAQGPARAAGGADPADLQRRHARAGARPAVGGRRAPGRPARQGRRAARGRRARHPRLLRVPARSLAQAQIDQSARALQPRDRPPHRRRRHLPRRPEPDPARRNALHRTERRVARRAPLPQRRVDLSRHRWTRRSHKHRDQGGGARAPAGLSRQPLTDDRGADSYTTSRDLTWRWSSPTGAPPQPPCSSRPSPPSRALRSPPTTCAAGVSWRPGPRTWSGTTTAVSRSALARLRSPASSGRSRSSPPRTTRPVRPRHSAATSRAPRC